MTKAKEVMMRYNGEARVFDKGIIGPEICDHCNRTMGDHRATDKACPHPDNYEDRKWLETKYE